LLSTVDVNTFYVCKKAYFFTILYIKNIYIYETLTLDALITCFAGAGSNQCCAQFL